MKYVLVDKYDNIIDTVEVDKDFAEQYFIQQKRMDKEKFKKLWSVMSEDEWNKKFKIGIRKSSYKGDNWWIEEAHIANDNEGFF